MKTTSEIKTEKMILAIKKRSMILSILNASEVPVPIPELLAQPELNEFNFTIKSLSLFVSTMISSKLVASVKGEYPDYPSARVGYVSLTSVKAKAKAIKTPKPAKVLLTHINKPSFIVDYIKETGRVRLELADLFIEIGVIQR